MRNYGKTQVITEDLKSWAQHQHGKHWNDGGAVESILEAAQKDLEQLVSDETKAAVQDYASSAQMALGVDANGHLLVGVRLYNEDAAIIVKVPFLQLVLNAINEIKPTIATNEEAMALLSAIVDAGNKLSNIGRGDNKGTLPRQAQNGASSHQRHAVRSVPVRPSRSDAEEAIG